MREQIDNFVPRSITLQGRIQIAAPANAAFRMFSPLGEKLWVPGWDPELLYPANSTWQEGLIFRTREETGDAVWIVSQLDMSAYRVTYYRLEPTRYAVRVEVRCNPITDELTEAVTEYSFVGLSHDGNDAIAAITQDSYDAKMARWANWIDMCLQSL